MKPTDIDFYHHWERLNRFYGVLNINKDLAQDLKAILDFQPGYYNHIQMRAIRDEYIKLPGIRFGWVMGKTAVQVSFCLGVDWEQFLKVQSVMKLNIYLTP